MIPAVAGRLRSCPCPERLNHRIHSVRRVCKKSSVRLVDCFHQDCPWGTLSRECFQPVGFDHQGLMHCRPIGVGDIVDYHRTKGSSHRFRSFLRAHQLMVSTDIQCCKKGRLGKGCDWPPGKFQRQRLEPWNCSVLTSVFHDELPFCAVPCKLINPAVGIEQRHPRVRHLQAHGTRPPVDNCHNDDGDKDNGSRQECG